MSNLTGAKFSNADLAGSQFIKADLTRVQLSDSSLVGANLRETVLCEAQLDGANLMKATLEAANLTDAKLTRTDLSGATLKGADLRGADLRGADLRGADLRGVKVGRSGQKPTQLNGARLNWHTALWESANVLDADWTELLVDEQRIQRADVESGEVRLTIEPPREGLTLYFNTKITVFDRYLVQGVIVGVLGRNTTCEIEEFRQGDSFAVLRLGGAPPEDLDRVADALWERVWEDIERQRGTALAHASGLDISKLGQSLSVMRDKLDRIERRTPSEDAIEYLDDTGAKHVLEKTRERFRTWDQKVVRKLGGAVVHKVLGEVGDAATDLVKDGLGLKED